MIVFDMVILIVPSEGKAYGVCRLCADWFL